MSDFSRKTVSIYIDHTAAEASLEKLQQRASSFAVKIEEAKGKQIELRAEIQKLTPAAENINSLKKQFQQLSDAIEDNSKELYDNKTFQVQLTKENEKLAASIVKAQEKVKAMRSDIDKNKESGKVIKYLETSYAALNKEIELNSKKLDINKQAIEGAKIEALLLEDALVNDRKRVADLNNELKNSQAAASNIRKLENEIFNLDKGIAKLDVSLSKVRNQQTGLINDIKNNVAPSINQQRALVQQLTREWEQLPYGAEAYTQKLEELNNAKVYLNEMQAGVEGVSKAQQSWFSNMKTIAAGVIIGSVAENALTAFSSYVSGIVTGNARMSDSLADISKATGLSTYEVEKLNSALSKIDTRSAGADLREIAIGLGQIGQQANKANVEAIDKTVVALGDEFGGGAREITTNLSVLRNNLQDIKTGSYADDILKIGNALNVAGAEGLATAPVVTEVANRISGIAQQFKVSSGQILGIAATFQELGIETERGSTAIIKLFQKIGAEPEKFSKITNLSVKEFSHVVNTDMVAAFEAVAKGAQKAGSDNVTFSKILKELDADGSGAGEVLSKFAANAQLLDTKVKSMSHALKNGYSVLDEFEKKNTTLGAELDKLKKTFERFVQSKTLADFFSAGVSALNSFIGALKATPKFINDNSTALKLMLAGIVLLNGGLIKSGALIVRDTALKVINATITKATAIATNIAVAAQAAYIQITTLLAGRITIATAAQRLWNIAMSLGAGPIGVIITLVGALVISMENLFGTTQKLNAALLNGAEVEKKVAESIGDQKESLAHYVEIAQDANYSLEIRKAALDKLIEQNPAYLHGLNLENITTQQGIDIINDYIDSLDRLATAKALVDIKSKLSKDRISQGIDLKVLQEESTNAGWFDQNIKNTFGLGKTDELEDKVTENLETTKRYNAATEQIDSTVRELNFSIGVQKLQLSNAQKELELYQNKLKSVKGNAAAFQEAQQELNSKTEDYNTILRKLNSTIRERNVYTGVDENTDLVGQPAKKTVVTPGTDPFATNDDKEQKKRDDLLEKLRQFQFELQQIGKTSDQSEIDRIKHKYAELTKDAGEHLAKLINLEKDKNRAIAFLIDEEIRKRKEASDKQFKETNSNEYDQALADNAVYFENLKKQQAGAFVSGQIDRKQYEANLAAIDVASKQAQLHTAEDYSANVEKAAEDVTKFRKELLDKEVADLIAANAKKLATEQLVQQLNKDAAIARATHAVNITAPGSKERLAAEKALLKEQEKQEIESINRREQEAIQQGIKYDQEFNELRAAAHDKYLEDEKKKELEHYTAVASFALDYFSQALSVLSMFNDNKNAVEQKALDKELKNYDKRKQALDRQLRQRLISQQTYNSAVKRLDEEADQKKEELERKQFYRKKKLQTAEALIDVSKAIMTDIRNYGAPIPPNFLSMAAVGMDAVIGAAKIAAIQGQQYATGGKVEEHSNGRVIAKPNIPIQPNGDNVLATIKTGEVVLNEEQQKRAGGPAFFKAIGVPGFASGGVIKPAYQSRSYQPINFTGATQSIQTIKHFSTGRLFTQTKDEAIGTDPVLLASLQETKDINAQLAQTNLLLINTVITLTNQLSKGIKAEVPLKKITDAQETRSRILQEATFQ